ncbi:MAG TPA: hypothetical protein VGF98_11030 [Candidatus Tumulicola sp.]|jgi:hypothetical protein
MDFVPFDDSTHPDLMRYQNDIQYAAAQAKIPSCFLATIVWRETGGQNIFQTGKSRGPGCGVGLAQITSDVIWDNSEDPTYGKYRLMVPSDNLYVAANYFIVSDLRNAQLAQINDSKAFNQSCRGQLAFAAACAYNAGWHAVELALTGGTDADITTTHGYGADVLSKYIELCNNSHK